MWTELVCFNVLLIDAKNIYAGFLFNGFSAFLVSTPVEFN
jgi:hypothetical protein